MPLNDEQADDVRMAQALSDRIKGDLRRVVDGYQQLNGDYGPTFARFITLHAVQNLRDELLLEAEHADPERARQWRRHLDEYATPVAGHLLH